MISIIEDDPHVRQAIINLMRSLGLAAAAFASAEEFLASDRVDDAECLIVDVQLPGLSGLELQGQLRAAGKTTPVIFITALSDDRVRLSAMDGGAIGCLGKPFDTRSLIDCLDRALPGRAAAAAGKGSPVM
jgi:FixJ family two-component response regulator